MFIDLLHLYKKQKDSGKTPLEDFNTEAFANIIKMYPVIKDDFIENFLELPKDNYFIQTQLKKDLTDYQNCIIDLTFIGNENICFIENKVESSEGDKQLERYSKVLDEYFRDKKHYLYYCTKYSDPKNENNQFDKYNFKQFKWYEIAKFLKKYKESSLIINEYLNFLNKYKMAQDNTFKSENLITLENLNKTLEIMEFHISNCRHEFNEMFGYENYNKNFNWEQIRDNWRYAHYCSGILKSNIPKMSEILYSFEFYTLELNCHIWVPKNHQFYKEFTKLQFNEIDFTPKEGECGYSFHRTTSLGNFLNSEESDIEIKNWFLDSFDKFRNLMIQNTNEKLQWNI